MLAHDLSIEIVYIKISDVFCWIAWIVVITNICIIFPSKKFKIIETPSKIPFSIINMSESVSNSSFI